MADLASIPTFAAAEGTFHVVVESPRGATVKLKYDRRLGTIVWGRPLTVGLSYPFDWGFVPGTRAADGDPVDAMILWEGSTYPGVVVPCRAVAVVRIEQNRADHSGRERNDRIIAVPANAARVRDLAGPDDLPARLRDELAAFFLQVTAFEKKDVAVLEWDTAERALELIR
jgi:inorganic pyrophosphatase